MQGGQEEGKREKEDPGCYGGVAGSGVEAELSRLESRFSFCREVWLTLLCKQPDPPV